MPRTIRFHLRTRIADVPWRRACGVRVIDVTTKPEAGLVEAGDEQQDAFALAEGRMIFTQDDAFMVWHGFRAPHAGIAIPQERLRKAISGEMIQGRGTSPARYTTKTKWRTRVEYL